MKTFIKAGLFFSALVSYAANAITYYDFSYTFNDHSIVTGSLSGNLNGSYLNNVDHVHVFLNGTEFSGSLFSAAWNSAIQDWDNSIGAKVSPNASLNNFLFADANVPADYNVSNYFYFVNDVSSLGHEAFAVNLNTNDIALDNPTNRSWSLVAQVPEPGTYAMLLLGLGLVGTARYQKMRRS